MLMERVSGLTLDSVAISEWPEKFQRALVSVFEHPLLLVDLKISMKVRRLRHIGTWV